MAQRGLNKVMLIGNLGDEPEVRFTASGSAVANLAIATSETWKDKNTGQQQEKTEWHRAVAFGKLAEIIQQYLHKGSKVYIEGKLQTRKWQDNNGQDRYTTEIVANEMQMLDSRAGVASVADSGAQAAGSGTATAQAAQTSQPAKGHIDDFDDDIPFAKIGDEHLF